MSFCINKNNIIDNIKYKWLLEVYKKCIFLYRRIWMKKKDILCYYVKFREF